MYATAEGERHDLEPPYKPVYLPWKHVVDRMTSFSSRVHTHVQSLVYAIAHYALRRTAA